MDLTTGSASNWELLTNQWQHKDVLPVVHQDRVADCFLLNFSGRVNRWVRRSCTRLADVVEQNNKEGEEVEVDGVVEQLDSFKSNEHALVATLSL